METCVRGFSFMPESKVGILDLKYIEGGELERAWKATRRQRLKQQEQKIWDEFIKEKDIVHTVCEDDPYQFLEQLPEGFLRELMESELQKLKQEQSEEETKNLGQSGEAPQYEEHVHHTVTFADDAEKEEDGDIFHIFDSEKDDDISGPEEEVINDSMGSPCTVRENPTGDSSPVQKSFLTEKDLTKSSENMTNLIESSIYCAKVKDIRTKIYEEMTEIMAWLERQDILMVEPDEVTRMFKRAGEFCGRFNRIYMYQLQRQMHDVKRNSNTALPFAKHTQFQSQMVRIVSLHQNLLQAYQVFHRSVEQTWCLRECDEMLHALMKATREVSAVCRAAPTPKDFAAAVDLYNDEVLQMCDKLDQVVDDYGKRMADFVKNIDRGSSTNKSKKSARNKKKASFGSSSKSGSKSDAEARLSMYSLDTIRNNTKTKSTSSKDNQSSGTSKMRGEMSTVTDDSKKPPGKKNSPRKKASSSGRMGESARRRAAARREPRTLVQAVPQCASSHISCEVSPRVTPFGSAEPSPRGRTTNTPRTGRTNNTARKSQPTTPRPRQGYLSPRSKPRESPRPKPLKAVIADLTFDQDTVTDSSIHQMTPIDKCTESKVEKNDNAGEIATGNEGHDKQGEENTNEESCKAGGNVEKVKVSNTPRHTPRTPRESEKRRMEREGYGVSNSNTPGYDVTRLLRQLCSGDGVMGRNERVTGVKNAQLLCISGNNSPRQPSTPQLLRILEETIQKKVPKPLYQTPSSALNKDKYRLTFNIAESTAQNVFQYRTKFVQHMLTSPMYANSAVGKPWEIIGSISEKIIDELLLNVAKEMELARVTQEIYKTETR